MDYIELFYSLADTPLSMDDRKRRSNLPPTPNYDEVLFISETNIAEIGTELFYVFGAIQNPQ